MRIFDAVIVCREWKKTWEQLLAEVFAEDMFAELEKLRERMIDVTMFLYLSQQCSVLAVELGLLSVVCPSLFIIAKAFVSPHHPSVERQHQRFDQSSSSIAVTSLLEYYLLLMPHL